MAFKKLFGTFATAIAHAAGTPAAFVLSLLVIVGWAISGPIFGFSDTWQLIINTGTTIVTFLMVFVIQNSQNRDGAAIQAKLDELIRTSKAQNRYIGIEGLTEDELDELRKRCVGRARSERLKDAREGAEQGQADADQKAREAAERATGVSD